MLSGALTVSAEPGETGEVADTVFTLLVEEDCQILSALAASLRGSAISSFIKWVLQAESQAGAEAEGEDERVVGGIVH